LYIDLVFIIIIIVIINNNNNIFAVQKKIKKRDEVVDGEGYLRGKLRFQLSSSFSLSLNLKNFQNECGTD
jgi:hypothetical protein